MKDLKTICFVILAATQLSAQDTLKIEYKDGIISGYFIEPYTNSWNVYLQSPDGSENQIRYWTDYAQIIVQNGVNILHRVQDLYSPDGSLQSTWINVVEQESLHPIKFATHAPNGALFFLEFETGRVITRSNQNEEGTYRSDTSLVSSQLYDWNLYGMLLIGLPFGEGKVFQFDYWNIQNNSQASLYATIGPEVDVETLSGEKVKTREISTSDGFTFSLSKKAPYVIKLVWDLPNGSKMIWRKI